ncbi:hypothetical protein NDU88_009742, partial [Pleurodeles waltl]
QQLEWGAKCSLHCPWKLERELKLFIMEPAQTSQSDFVGPDPRATLISTGLPFTFLGKVMPTQTSLE